MAVCRRGLSVVDRTLIEVRLQDEWCIRALGRSPGMMSNEVARHSSTACCAADMAISHEAVYALPRGELRRELIVCLRQGKPQRGRTPPFMSPGTASGAARCAT